MKTIAALLSLALLIACKDEQVAVTSVSDTPEPLAFQRAAAPSAEGAAAASTSRSVAPETPRQIVRTATMRIVVADTAKAVADVTAAVEALDGFIAGSEIWREGELLRARLTLRVPTRSLSPALAAIRNVATKVDNETIASEDVTQQSVDLQARLRNLEATEGELRELLKTVRVNARKAADILEVHQQLTAVRGEIETTRARIEHLGHNVAMSHIALEMIPDAATKPVVEERWQPVVIVKDASRALVVSLRAFAAAAIWLVIYVVPVVGLIALMAAGAGTVAYRLRRRRSLAVGDR